MELQRLGFTTNVNGIGIHDGSDDAMVCTVRLIGNLVFDEFLISENCTLLMLTPHHMM